MKLVNCRFCKTNLKKIFVDLGITPLANSFIKKNDLYKNEAKYPLRVYVCTECLLVQLEEYETPDNIFHDYAYFSSYSDTWLNHAKDYTENIIKKLKLNKTNQIIEIASNDGYLLQYFLEKGIPVLGIEPAFNVAKIAQEKGIPTIQRFFGLKTAKELIHQSKKADLLIGNNVLAHVPNLIDFVKGLKELVEPDGMITLEFPHLLQLIEKNQFDTIYHEHFSYFSFFVVQKILLEFGLIIVDVEEISTHGGSLRIFVKRKDAKILEINQNVFNLLKKEKDVGFFDLSFYEDFPKKIKKIKDDLLDFILKEKDAGKKIVCYGAAAKGNTLLNFCQINSTHIDYVVDQSPHKQGLFLPGTHIPILSPKKIIETKPDYIFILPWNLKDEIMIQLNYVKKWGCKFLIAIPEVSVLQ